MTRATSSTTPERVPSPSVGYATSPDGTQIGFERTGAGSPLVLVHGTSANRTRWAPILPALEQRFTVYAMDRRGRGLSTDTAPFALEREFEDVAAVVNEIGEPVDVLGHSYGALCAMEAALRSRSVRRLVLYEPAIQTDEPLYEEGAQQRLEAMIERGEREKALETFFVEVVGVSERELGAMRADPSWAARVAAVHTVPREFADGDYVLDPRRISGLTMPVLMLTGSETLGALRTSTDRIDSALPNSRVQVMEGQGHVAVTSAPDLFTQLVVDFLTS